MTKRTRSVDAGHRSQFPDFLTIEEAAEVLRIGRGAAYALARLHETSNGATGLPVVRIGKQRRVPRAVLERWNEGPLTTRATTPTPSAASPAPMPPATRRRATRPDPNVLPFNA